ncbi:MAG: hypothetical protein O2913_11325 [Chloroflexi bacterium]|nr:hypothetical protein [Chloroflexota bacterium]
MPSAREEVPILGKLDHAIRMMGYECVTKENAKRHYQHQEQKEVALFIEWIPLLTFLDLDILLEVNGINLDAFYANYDTA